MGRLQSLLQFFTFIFALKMAAMKEKTFYIQLNDGKITENIQDLGKSMVSQVNETQSIVLNAFYIVIESFVPGDDSHFTNQSYVPSTTNADQTGDMFFYSMRQSISPGRDITFIKPNQIDENEPPLLEELEIHPERILHKSLLILNPFHVDDTHDKSVDLGYESDLAGPIVFCLLFGVCLFVAGSKIHFGYIYGLSMISVCGMYALLLMLTDEIARLLTFARVASALGYGILPIVWLSIFSIFVSLNSTFGIIIAMMCITLATLGSSRMLCLLAHDTNKRLLIAYPCALAYIAFTFLVLF